MKKLFAILMLGSACVAAHAGSPQLAGTNTFTGDNYFQGVLNGAGSNNFGGPVTATNPANQFAGVFSGGFSVTNILNGTGMTFQNGVIQAWSNNVKIAEITTNGHLAVELSGTNIVSLRAIGQTNSGIQFDRADTNSVVIVRHGYQVARFTTNGITETNFVAQWLGGMNFTESYPGANDVNLSLNSPGAGMSFNWNPGHANEQEGSMVSSGAIAFVAGLDGLGKAHFQMGGAAHYHTTFYFDFDDPTSNLGNAATNLLGASMPFGWQFNAYSNGVVTHVGMWQVKALLTNGYQGNYYYDIWNPTPDRGFNQAQHDAAPEHIAGALFPDYIAWGGADLTNEVTRGIAATSGNSTSFTVNWTRATPDILTYTPSGNFLLTNAAFNFTNYSVTKDIIIHTQFSAVVVTNSTNWITESAMGTNLPVTNVPSGMDLHIHLMAVADTATNYYAHYWLGTNSFAVDPAAAAFITASGITGASDKVAVNYLVSALKTAGLWSRWDCIYPMVGATSNTCSWNLADTTKYRIAWTVGSSTFTTNGWNSDGTASFGDTQFNPSTASSPNYTGASGTMLFYNRTASPTGSTPAAFMGAFGGSCQAAIGNHDGVHFGVWGFNFNAGEGSLALPAPYNGTIAYSISGGTFYFMSPTFIQTGSAAGNCAPNANVFIGGRNAGGISQPIGAGFSLVMLGGGLNSTEYATQTNIVANFEALRSGL